MIMNIKVRGEVLEKALVLEDAVNNLVLLYLGIKKEDRRAIGHKSGTLTYKNLLDLLYDIDVLDREEWRELLVLMEVRNQFMHNIAFDSFDKAISLLGNDRGKILLGLNTIGGETIEQKYSNGFLELAIKCIGIVRKKIELKKQDIKEKSAYVRKLLDFIVQYDEMIHNKLDALLDNFDFEEPLEGQRQFDANRLKLILHVDVIELKQEFVDKFGDFTSSIYDESQDIADRILK
jgi:hypothetical protein